MIPDDLKGNIRKNLRVFSEGMTLVWLFLWLLIFSVVNSSGDDFKVTPSISLKQEYNDNIDFDEDDEIDDFITTISPGISIQEKTERLSARLAAELGFLEYADNSDLDTVDQYYSGRFRYQLTPRMGMGLEGSYRKDSRADRDIDTTGLVLGGDRKIQKYSGSWDYYITEKTQAVVSYTYGREDIDPPDYEEGRYHSAGLTFNHDLSEWIPATTGIVNFNYLNYDSTEKDEYPSAFFTQKIRQESDSDVYSATIGLSRQYTETFSVAAHIGTSYTEIDESSQMEIFGITFPSETSSSSKWGVVGGASLAYKGEYSNYDLSVSHDVRPASGRNGTSERTAVVFNTDRKFSDRLHGLFTVGYYRNRTDQEVYNDEDERTFRIKPGVRYNFTKDFYVVASYLYTEVEEKEDDETTKRNLVYVKLTKNFEL